MNKSNGTASETKGQNWELAAAIIRQLPGALQNASPTLIQAYIREQEVLKRVLETTFTPETIFIRELIRVKVDYGLDPNRLMEINGIRNVPSLVDWKELSPVKEKVEEMNVILALMPDAHSVQSVITRMKMLGQLLNFTELLHLGIQYPGIVKKYKNILALGSFKQANKDIPAPCCPCFRSNIHETQLIINMNYFHRDSIGWPDWIAIQVKN